MREPWNLTELQSSYTNIFQVLTCTRHYTDYHPSAKANGGRETQGEMGALKVLPEMECNSPQNNCQGKYAKDHFWTLGKIKAI